MGKSQRQYVVMVNETDMLYDNWEKLSVHDTYEEALESIFELSIMVPKRFRIDELKTKKRTLESEIKRHPSGSYWVEKYKRNEK